jgi:hypothetical protein
MEADLRGGVLAMCVDMQQRVGDMTQVRTCFLTAKCTLLKLTSYCKCHVSHRTYFVISTVVTQRFIAACGVMTDRD